MDATSQTSPTVSIKKNPVSNPVKSAPKNSTTPVQPAQPTTSTTGSNVDATSKTSPTVSKKRICEKSCEECPKHSTTPVKPAQPTTSTTLPKPVLQGV